MPDERDERKSCGDCGEYFEDIELFCAGSAERVSDCTVHPNGTCTEVYCESCWEAETM